MKKIIQFIKIYYKIITVILLTISAFYWFEIRPTHIKAQCEKISQDYIKAHPWITMTQATFKYTSCLHENGI